MTPAASACLHTNHCRQSTGCAGLKQPQHASFQAAKPPAAAGCTDCTPSTATSPPRHLTEQLRLVQPTPAPVHQDGATTRKTAHPAASTHMHPKASTQQLFPASLIFLWAHPAEAYHRAAAADALLTRPPAPAAPPAQPANASVRSQNERTTIARSSAADTM